MNAPFHTASVPPEVWLRIFGVALLACVVVALDERIRRVAHVRRHQNEPLRGGWPVPEVLGREVLATFRGSCRVAVRYDP